MSVGSTAAPTDSDPAAQRMCPLCGILTDLASCPQDGKATIRGAGSQAFGRLGELIGDRYRLTELLGRGGFGDVYKAFHVGTHEHVALKILRADLGLDPSAVDRFTAEARMSAGLRHPNTVRVFDFGTTPDQALYLAMEYLDGDSLEVLVEAKGRLPPRRTVHLAIQILKSLAEAHGKHIIHRDLKPENIFVVELAGEKDFVRVIDFGIAKFLGDSQNLTMAGAILGTPHFMSPEQIRGDVLDARSDLYALGAVLYRCLTGEFACDGDNQFGVLAAHLSSLPVPLHEFDPKIDAQLSAIVMRTLEKQRDARFADAESMRAALEAWLAHAPADPPEVDSRAMTPIPGASIQDNARTQAMAIVIPRPELNAAEADSSRTQAMPVLVIDQPSALSTRPPSRTAPAAVPLAPTAVPMAGASIRVTMPRPVEPPAKVPAPVGELLVVPVPSDKTRVGLDVVREPPLRSPAVNAGVAGAERKHLGLAGDSSRRPQSAEPRRAPSGRPAGEEPLTIGTGRGLQRRGKGASVAAAPVRTDEPRAITVVAKDPDAATERGTALPRKAAPVPRSWLPVGVAALLLVGGALGIFLAWQEGVGARSPTPTPPRVDVPARAPASPPKAPNPHANSAVVVEPAAALPANLQAAPVAVGAGMAVAAADGAPVAEARKPAPARVKAAAEQEKRPIEAAAPAAGRAEPGKCGAAEGTPDWCRQCPEARQLASRSKWFCGCREARDETSGLSYYCACKFPRENFARGSADWCKCNAGDPACQ